MDQIMLDQIIMIVATAVLSSLLTVALAAIVLKRIAVGMEERLERRLHEKLAETAEEVGETIEARLRRVVQDAAKDFRAASLAAGATRSVAVTGAELMQEGLRILMGGGSRNPGTGSAAGGSGQSSPPPVRPPIDET